MAGEQFTNTGIGGFDKNFATTGSNPTFIFSNGIGGDLASIGKALGSLFQGDFPSFFQNLFNAAPGIGAFLIIYALMSFVSSITIFKAEEHKKYAHMFGIGIALIGIMNAQVYSILVTLLGGSFIVLLIVLFIVFGFIIVFNRMRTSHNETAAETAKARTKKVINQTEGKKADNEKRATNSLKRRERIARKQSQKSVMHLEAETNDSMHLIKQMEVELGYVSRLQSEGQSTQKVRQGVLSTVASFAADLKEEINNVHNVRVEVKKLATYSYNGLKVDLKEDKDVDIYFQKLKTSSAGGANQINTNASKKRRDLIRAYAKKAEALDQRRLELEKKMLAEANDLERKLQDVEPHKTAFVDALNNDRIGDAQSNLAIIKQEFEIIRSEDIALNGQLQLIRNFDKELQSFHKEEFEDLHKALNT